MDLIDTPDRMKISTRSVVVKPENQANITQGTNRIVKFHVPENIGYFKPSESNFTFNLKMSGRGRPIPDRACGGFHSLIHNIRTLDGTNSHRLEESLEYNTYSAQLCNYTHGESTDNKRAMYEGYQASKSVKNNLYWALGGNNWTTGDGLVTESVARTVQICSPLNTKMLSTDQFIPNAVLGGVRLELELDDYRRSLIYTTGKLGVERQNGLVTLPNLLLGTLGGRGKVGTGTTECLAMTITGAGSGFEVNKIYRFYYAGSPSSDQVGFIRANAVTGAGGITEAEIYAIGGASGTNASVKQPEPGDQIVIKDAVSGSDATATILPGILGNPAGIICNQNQEIEIPIFTGLSLTKKITGDKGIGDYLAEVGNTQSGKTYVPSPAGIFTSTGSAQIGTEGSLRNPTENHFMNPAYQKNSAEADIDSDDCFPETNVPFDIGDSLYVGTLDTSQAEKYVGLVSRIKRYGGTTPAAPGKNEYAVICVKPNYAALTLASGQTPGATPNSLAFGGQDFGFFEDKKGLVVYTKNSERLNGVAQTADRVGQITDNVLKEASKLKVDYEISDLQYQVCEVSMDDSVLSSDMAAANSEKGLQIDLETVHTNLTNLIPNTGPNSQLINTGTIERALGVMSIPLLQNNQRNILEPAFNGEVDTMINYQWRLGINGLVPNQPVAVEKAQSGFPITQSQYLNETLKAVESFGIPLTNLHKVLMNFAVPRAFSRTGMFYDLVKAGSLSLQTENGTVPLRGAKLFVHFINHLRSINISNNGIVIRN